jgi:hypothetical protein
MCLLLTNLFQIVDRLKRFCDAKIAAINKLVLLGAQPIGE